MEARRPALAPSYEPPYPPEAEADLDRVRGNTARLRLWWRHRKFLGHVVWVSALLSTVVALVIPKRFESTARLVIPDNQASSNFASLINRAAGGASSSLGLDPTTVLGLKTPGAFYTAVLQSRTVQDRLVEEYDLRKHYSRRYIQDARKRLDANTDITEDKKSGVITLSVRDWSPQFAAMLVRSYIEEMNRVATGLNVSGAHLEREFLEERLRTAKQDLDRASMELSEFSSEHAVTDVQQQGRTMMDAVAKLQGELIANQAELKGMEQIYSDDNVRVRTLRARVSELQAQLRKMVGDSTDPADVTARQPDGTYPAVRALPALGYRYQELYREAKIQETVFEFLTDQYELARVQEAKEVPVFRVMDAPDVPEKKVTPKRTLIIALSIALALFLGCWWVLIRERWDRLSASDSRRLFLAEIRSDLGIGKGSLSRQNQSRSGEMASSRRPRHSNDDV